MRSSGPATKAPKVPKALPRVPTKNRDLSRAQPRQLQGPAALSAPTTPSPWASSTMSRPRRILGHPARSRSGSDVAVHAEDPVVAIKTGGVPPVVASREPRPAVDSMRDKAVASAWGSGAAGPR